jgi:UDP-glucuronate 4-epimerase
MRILVTGGAGFIGSHVAERLVRDGHAVVILDQLNEYYAPALKLQNVDQVRRAGPVTFIQGDINDQDAVFEIAVAHRIEAVVHLAALVGVGASIQQPLDYERVNVQGTMVLLEAARRCGARKFVFASSSSVYGGTRQVPFREDDPDAAPISPYGATKLAAERMCYVYAHLHRLPVVCLRFFTVCGPRQRPDLALYKFVRLIESGQRIPVFGDGASCRDYTFCGDIVEGVVAALGLDTAYDVFNLGSSRPIALRTVIETLEQTLGRCAEIDRLPDQPGDIRVTCADISKAERLLGYRPATSFEEGVRRLVEWHRKHRAVELGGPY